MTFEEALVAWLRAGGVPEDCEIENPRIEHEPWYGGEAGTMWPATTWVYYDSVKIGRTGQRHVKSQSVAGDGDVGTFLAELFATSGVEA